MATLAANPYPLPPLDYRSGVPYEQQPNHVELMRLIEESDNLDLDAGEIVGGVLKWQRADGYAWYRVSKERPLTLQFIDTGDGYTVEDALIRGLNKQDVLTMLHRERRIRQAFRK